MRYKMLNRLERLYLEEKAGKLAEAKDYEKLVEMLLDICTNGLKCRDALRLEKAVFLLEEFKARSNKDGK